jgi:hypothetical protein
VLRQQFLSFLDWLTGAEPAIELKNRMPDESRTASTSVPLDNTARELAIVGAPQSQSCRTMTLVPTFTRL